MEFSKHSQGTTSVVVKHAPGGASSIQIGGDSGPVPVKTAVAVKQQAPSQISWGGYGDDKTDSKVAAKPGQGSYVKPSQQTSGIQIGGGYGDLTDSQVSAKPGAIPSAVPAEEEEEKKDEQLAGAGAGAAGVASAAAPTSAPAGAVPVKTSVKVINPYANKSTALW